MWISHTEDPTFRVFVTLFHSPVRERNKQLRSLLFWFDFKASNSANSRLQESQDLPENLAPIICRFLEIYTPSLCQVKQRLTQNGLHLQEIFHSLPGRMCVGHGLELQMPSALIQRAQARGNSLTTHRLRWRRAVWVPLVLPHATLCTSKTRIKTQGGRNPPRVCYSSQEGKTNLSHDGLNPAHVPCRWVNNPTLPASCDREARKSRHRRIKKRRRYERLAATSQLSLW